MTNTKSEFEYFCGTKTEQGSFRSFADTWTGARGISKAVRNLLDGETVEMHICGHGAHGDDNTYWKYIFKVEKGRFNTYELRVSHSGYGGEYKICDAEAIDMASHIAMHLYSRCEKNQCVFRQPNERELKELGLTD